MVNEISRKFLTDRFLQYKLFVSVDGDFVDFDTHKMLRHNMLKCMLRRDYFNAGITELKGAALTKEIELFLAGIIKVASKISLLDQYKELRYAMEYSGEYM